MVVGEWGFSIVTGMEFPNVMKLFKKKTGEVVSVYLLNYRSNIFKL